jgi:hypothetical protein
MVSPFFGREPMKPNRPPGPPMTLGNRRELGCGTLVGYCLNDACCHQALIDVSKYPNDVEVPSFQRRIKCGNVVDVNAGWTCARTPTTLR